MLFEQFVGEYFDLLKTKPHYLRDGQMLMNFLHTVWPEEYYRISSLNYYDVDNIDCFYKDELIPKTLEHLENVWINYQDEHGKKLPTQKH